MSEKKLGPPEHVGPLRIERYRKDDGRQLILYSLEPDASSGPDTHSERDSDAIRAPEESRG